MSILQIKAMLSMHNANPSSRNFKNAPPSLKHNKSSTSLNGTKNGVKKVNASEKSVRKRSLPRTDTAPSQPKKMKKKEKKDPTHKLSQEAISMINLLQKLGKPFEQDLSQIVNHAGSALDAQDDSAGPINELLRMEQEWKNDHAGRLKQMTAFPQRVGVTPMSGVEATALKKAGSS